MRYIALATSVFLAVAQPSLAQEKTTLVLDASGSMWGQIEGEAKITIAQQVVAQLMQVAPASQEFGLSAYGHSRKGDCSDIETLVEPGPDTRQTITQAVNEISPKGKTPLSEAVQRAAEGLRYQESKATVILISDGVENCDVDPCAMARTLEETGVEFTAHVIGFDVAGTEAATQLACIAEETGGQYHTAETAEELGSALSQVAQIAPTDANGPTTLPDITLSAPDQADIASFIDVTWAGPDLSQGGFEVVVQSLDGTKINGTVIRTANTDELEMPVSAGIFQIALVKIAQQQVLTTRRIQINDVPVTLEAPSQVFVSEGFDVVWQGPGYRTDRIGIGPAHQRPSKAVMLGDKARSPIELTAPPTPGDYVVTYALSQDQTVLASRPITVLPAPPAVDEAFLACMQTAAANHPDPNVQSFASDAGTPDAPELTEAQAFNVAMFLMSLDEICGSP